MVKVVTISDESYAELKKWKGGKSFSETILGLAKTNQNQRILDFFKNLKRNDELADAVEEAYKQRRRFKLKDVKF